MSLISYAQNFEDVMLWRALRHVQGGRYLDIGAQSPIVDSVSKLFHLNGWSGVHVEPTPAYAAALRSDRPEDRVIQAAIAESGNSISFYEIPDTGLSTGVEEIAQCHVEQGYGVREINVPTMSLNQLLDDIGPSDIHWMKIDVEGMERAVLKSWSNHPTRPWIVLVESTFPNTQQPTHDQWIDLLTERGYHEVYFDGLSRYFVADHHRELDSAFSAPPNVFDGFSITNRHFSAGAIMAEQEAIHEAGRAELRSAEMKQLEAENSQALLASQLDHERNARRSDHKRYTEAAATCREQVAIKLGTLEASASELRRAVEQQRVSKQCALKDRDVARATAHRLEGQLQQLKADCRATVRNLHREARIAEAGWRAKIEEQQSKLTEQKAQMTSLEQQLLKKEMLAAELEIQFASQRQLHEADRQAQQHSHDELVRQKIELDRRLSIAEHHASLIAELIIKALEAPVSWWHWLVWSLGLTGKHSAHQALRVLEALVPSLKARFLEPVMSIAPVSGAQNPYLRADSLAELLSLHDVEFVRCAFVTVLGRQPDPAGELYYVNRIRHGHSKLEILYQLRKSPEARAHDPGITGFDRHLRRAAWGRRPFIGRIVRLMSPAMEGDSAFDRHSRSLINAVWRDRIDMRQLLVSRDLEAASTSNSSTDDFSFEIEQENDVGKNVVELQRRIETSELDRLSFQSPLQDYFAKRFF